jgi:hypothetical protein
MMNALVSQLRQQRPVLRMVPCPLAHCLDMTLDIVSSMR